MTEENNQLNKEILEKIKTGQVTMHSRLFLAWRATLWTIGGLLLTAAGIFLASFIVFALRASGVWDLPAFGYMGLVKFLAFFPWLFVPAVLLFMWLVQKFILRFSFAYKWPFVYTSLGVIAFVIIGGFFVASTPLHPKLYMFARSEKLPGAGRFYKLYGKARPNNFFVGNVIEKNSGYYLITSRENKQYKIIVTPLTKILELDKLDSGDCIEAIGEQKDNMFFAFFIKTFDSVNTYPFCREPNPELPPPPFRP